MEVTYSVFWILFSLSDAAITGTPPNANVCAGEFISLKWAYDTANIFAVEWKINGTLMLQYIPSQPVNNQYTYSGGYTSAKLTHITNGEINITSLTTSDNGNYSCQTTYTSGTPSVFEEEMVLTVYDMISTNLTCSYNQSVDTIDCSVTIPSSITAVTINGADYPTPTWPISGTNSATYTVCMAGNAANCRNDGIPQCISFEGRSQTTTAVEISIEPTNEQTTISNLPSVSYLYSIEKTVDITTKDVHSTTHEQFKITTNTSSVSSEGEGDKHIHLKAIVFTYSFCGILFLLSLSIIIYRAIRSPTEDSKESNTEMGITDSKHHYRIDCDNDQTNFNSDEQRRYENSTTETKVKENISNQMNCQRESDYSNNEFIFYYGSNKPPRMNESVEFEQVNHLHKYHGYGYDVQCHDVNGQKALSNHSHRQASDLQGYFFYRGK